MDLVIHLTPSEEAQISAAAKDSGIAPAELVKRLVTEHLPVSSSQIETDIDARLRQWQQQDGTPLMPDVPANVLFARWAEEDACMSDEEREAEDRLWEDLEQSIVQNERLLQLRRLT